MRNTVNRYSTQRGVASIIFILLVSLAITATSTGVIQTLRKNQEVSIATNAITHAETGTWAAAEAFRIYLESINQLSLVALGGDLPITMEARYGSLAAENITVQDMGNQVHRVSATITNAHAAARSTSALDIVYEVDLNGGAAEVQPPSARFNDSLQINGGIELTNNGDPVDLVVIGDVVLGGVSVNPINQISATGRVELNSSVTVNKIFAEDEVVLNSSTVNIVQSLGKVTTTGGTSVEEIWSNDDVLIKSSGRFEKIHSLKNIEIDSGGAGQGLLNAAENINLKNSGGVDSVEAIGDVSINWGFTVDSVITEGDITCPGTSWTNTSLLSANGTVTNCPGSDGATRTVEQGANNSVATMAPITARNFSAETIDVWELKDAANYFVWYDSTSNRIKVKVNGIEQMTDGATLTLGDYSSNGSIPPYYDYLCESVNSSGVCTAPTVPSAPLCFGESLWNRCISYNTGSKTFTLNPNQTAPGIIFFDGNVNLMNGHGVSTILASGHITTNGSYRQWAINFGGYEKICEANADHIVSAARARYTASFSKHFPTLHCDVANSDYVPSQTGNIGLAAGGVNPDLTVNSSGDYSGGNITLGATTDIVGAVLAGNIFKTNGTTNIHGGISAGSFGDIGGDHSLGGKTTIDFSSTEDFDGNDIPVVGNTPQVTAVPVAEILWARSL